MLDRLGHFAPKYRIFIEHAHGASLALEGVARQADMKVLVEPEHIDIVAEALAILATGCVLIGADLGMVWDLVGQRSGIRGRALVVGGIGNEASAPILQGWIEELQSARYAGVLVLMQLVAHDEHERLTLASLDGGASLALARCPDRAIMTASLDATCSAVVVIALDV